MRERKNKIKSKRNKINWKKNKRKEKCKNV